jgi:hypothetical protein
MPKVNEVFLGLTADELCSLSQSVIGSRWMLISSKLKLDICLKVYFFVLLFAVYFIFFNGGANSDF